MDEEIKILIVDDDPAARLVIQRFLNVHGYRTEEAASAYEALSLLSRRNFALLISDWKMPGMDGLDLCRQVREHFPEVPVVIMSGVALGEEEARQAGAVGRLQKPFGGRALRLVIERALAGQATVGREATVD